MSYQYDLSDFKRYLNDKNPKYRVDGLIFWQNRIPLPIDLFNRIFEESDHIVCDYIYHIAASVIVMRNRHAFEKRLGINVAELPSEKLKHHLLEVDDWVSAELNKDKAVVELSHSISEFLGLSNFTITKDRIVKALLHQGKKYTRLYIPEKIRTIIKRLIHSHDVGKDNTDMFGNIIADRYDIYRSGFGDALAIIFNALLDFRLLCSGHGKHLQNIRVTKPIIENSDIRLGKTTDGSLWEPGYEDDHFVTLNREHPLVRNLTEEQSTPLAELLFFLGEFENTQFSDANKKLFENQRQAISRNLWIKHD